MTIVSNDPAEAIAEQRPLTLRVIALKHEAAGVLTVELANADGAALPIGMPGSNIDIALTAELFRQYSLSGSVGPDAYSLTVAFDEGGRGGSAYVHRTLRPGDVLRASVPANNFDFVDAPSYVFVAGGIGITPFRSMIARAEEAGRPWELYLAVRSRQRLPFTRWLQQFEDRVHVFVSDEGRRLNLADIAASADPDAAIYCCGPERMILEAEGITAENGRVIHIERFHAKEVGSPVRAGAFAVRCVRSDVRLDVDPEQSILDVLEGAGLPVRSSCREGTCGTCELAVLRGTVDHRDSLLSEDEKEANDTMMVCVSRAISDELELDI